MDALPAWASGNREAIAHLIQSPGWAILVAQELLPTLQKITAQLDKPGVDQSGHADFLRGQKRAYLHLIDLVYTCARRPNPLERHALGLLRAVTGEREPQPDGPSPPEVTASPPPAGSPSSQETRRVSRHTPV